MTSSTLRTILIAFAVAIAVAIGAYAIGSNGKAEPVAKADSASVQTTPTPEPTREPAPQAFSLTDNASLTEGEQLFVAAIEDYDGIDYTAAEEADIAAGGTQVCTDLADGYDPLDEALFIADALGVTEYEGGLVVGMATGSICPEFLDEALDSADAAINAY